MTTVLPRSRGVSMLFGLVVVAVLAAPARAEVRRGDTVIVGENEIVNENLYASGGTVAIRGVVRGDLVVAGGTILVEGLVTGDVLAAGGQISIAGRVIGDVRAAGGQISLLAPVGGDAVIAGGDVHVTAPVARDALLVGGSAVIAAPVGGALVSASGETRISDRVGGDVIVQGGRLRLERGASVDGDVHFTGPRALEREPGAAVGGVVTQQRAPRDEAGIGAFLYGWLQILTGLFVLGLIFLLLFRGFAQRSMETLRTQPGKSAALGVAAFFGIPLVVALVFLLGTFVGGAWLGLFGIAIYGIALALCFPLLAAFLGLAVVGRVKREQAASWWPMLLGLIALTALLFIPFLGPLIALATMLFGLGAIVLTLVPTLRFTRTPRTDTAPLPSTPASMSSRI